MTAPKKKSSGGLWAGLAGLTALGVGVLAAGTSKPKPGGGLNRPTKRKKKPCGCGR